MKVLDLFSGIGGFSLGLERAGMETVAFCEIDPWCRKLLRARWPGPAIFKNVETLSYERLAASGIVPDVICGGFPCQDISLANNRGIGIEGKKSGLWSELFRLIREIRPSYAIVENVSALLNRGLDRVCRDLASIGYDAVWHCIPASHIGAPHQRDRIWIVAYPCPQGRISSQGRAERLSRQVEENIIAYTHSNGRETPQKIREWVVSIGGRYWFETVAPILGVDDGYTDWTHRIKALGNAVVPQIPEIIGRAIMELEQ